MRANTSKGTLVGTFLMALALICATAFPVIVISACVKVISSPSGDAQSLLSSTFLSSIYEAITFAVAGVIFWWMGEIADRLSDISASLQDRGKQQDDLASAPRKQILSPVKKTTPDVAVKSRIEEPGIYKLD